MISKAIAVVNGLKDCLDFRQGELPNNLRDLYEYIVDQLFQANRASDREAIENVRLLLKTIRESWAQIPPNEHQVSSVKSFKNNT